MAPDAPPIHSLGDGHDPLHLQHRAPTGSGAPVAGLACSGHECVYTPVCLYQRGAEQRQSGGAPIGGQPVDPGSHGSGRPALALVRLAGRHRGVGPHHQVLHLDPRAHRLARSAHAGLETEELAALPLGRAVGDGPHPGDLRPLDHRCATRRPGRRSRGGPGLCAQDVGHPAHRPHTALQGYERVRRKRGGPVGLGNHGPLILQAGAASLARPALQIVLGLLWSHDH